MMQNVTDVPAKNWTAFSRSTGVAESQAQATAAAARAVEERGNNTLQPYSLFSPAATQGSFSLNTVFDNDAGPVGLPGHAPSMPAEDPVRLRLVHQSVAKSLFDNFMSILNPYISQLDPVLHTFECVQQQSTLLFSSILSAAAKSFNPALYTRLHNHAETLLADSFRHGHKSTAVIQAIMINTYWKEPKDTRAWTALGYAIRLGMDLANECSISLQTGKPWMIERDTFMESINPWCKDPLATANDALLGAFVTLRLLSSEVFKLLGPKPWSSHGSCVYNFDSLLAIIRGRIEEWEARWIACVDTADISSNLEILWVSYSSAMNMLNLVCRFAPRLYFAQDSVHIMTAYSAAFLVKLLLSAPESIVAEIENKTVAAICASGQAFSQQAAPDGSSCALQAKFLEKVLSNFKEKRGEQPSMREMDSITVPLQQPERNKSGDTASESYRQAQQPLSAQGIALETEERSTFLTGTVHDGLDLYQTELEAAPSDYFEWADLCANAGFSIQDGVFFAREDYDAE
ncbi:hypothetical protein CMQ_3418 [Grosmannia clavigera kw1407]|uniref:Uncharacterized protein n=1 Tax=Grosmannia clavigera (strain kw1407 / UAMH 11150) TaxID=655863 RepID=F0X9Q5_GROCL|nr:uncharacterized protein CMQ_3418 [Grosmannia clavigera kw1407]EFX05349.1 hypothetical protein CMQ_3418 [Grosmannia clavigera kw1407]